MEDVWTEAKVEDSHWDKFLSQLSCGSLFQTAAWGRYKSGFGWTCRRFVCENKSQLVGAALILSKKKGPVTIAWVPGGPAGNFDALSFKLAFKKSTEKPFYLRIKPQTPTSSGFEGFKVSKTFLSAPLTMELDLSIEETELRKNLSQNWRHNLKRSEKSGIRTSIENLSASEVSKILRTTEELKDIQTQYSEVEIAGLLREFKVVHSVARDENGEILALRSAILKDHLAWDLFAGSTELARKKYSSNLVTWLLLLECKKQGVRSYDLMGVDPENNPGVFSFKKGLGAKLVEYPGEFECASFAPIRWALNTYLKGRSL
jgi:lipid II:glycine glycyltransferase (peptidoglycan interpeptide bridge formation enzyme)